MKCFGALCTTEVSQDVTVAGAAFSRRVAAGDALRFDLCVARELGSRGAVTGDAFRFMRKTLGMRTSDVALIIGVAAETISNWERGENPVDRWAITVLGSLVTDKLEGRATTMENLKVRLEQRAVEGRPLAVVTK